METALQGEGFLLSESLISLYAASKGSDASSVKVLPSSYGGQPEVTIVRVDYLKDSVASRLIAGEEVAHNWH